MHLYCSSFLAPPVGLEPTTTRLTAACSANWAKEEYLSQRLSPLWYLFRRRPTFPGGFPPSIISTAELNYRVRNGNGCDLCVIVTEYFSEIALQSQNWIMLTMFNNSLSKESVDSLVFRSSPRSISIAQLHTLLHFHLRPINHVVYMGPYSFRMGYLILRWASRLDAFSVYPFRT